MADTIRIVSDDKNTTTVKIGDVVLCFSYSTLVGIKSPAPEIGYVVNPDGKGYGVTTAKHITAFGLKGASTTATEADFQAVALGAVQGSIGPAHLIIRK